MNGKRRRLFLIDDDLLAMNELKQRLESSTYIQVCGEAAKMEEVWSGIQATQPDIMLVGSVKQTEVGVLCQQIRFQFPHIMFIAACSARELHWEPFFRNLGIWVLTKPVEIAQLEILSFQSGVGGMNPMSAMAATASTVFQTPTPAMLTVSELRNEPAYPALSREDKHLITVYGPKGGVGKTFLSRELAIYFTQQKKEGRPLKVLAVDFNLDLGTIATSLNLPRTPNLFTWVKEIDDQLAQLVRNEGKEPESLPHQEWQEYTMAARISPQDIQKYVVIHPDTNLHVLTSPRDIRQSFEIKDYHLYLILETLKRSDYDVVFIDTAPDTTDATIQALFFAQKVVMVGNPVVDAIENIQRMLKLLREAEYPEERIQICINRVQRREMFTVEEIRAYFQLHPGKVLYTIPDDQEVKRSINTGIPLMLYPGKSTAKESIEALGNSLVMTDQGGSSEAQGKGKEKKKRQPLFSWLRKS